MSDKNWFVVHTKPRQERIAVENLERQGFTTYCPQTIQSKRLYQRWQKVREPLFPRYLFVQLNVGVDNFAPIRSTLGVIGLVRFGIKPAMMPHFAIQAIQRQEREIHNTCTEHPLWLKGDILQILEGPFAGLRGVFLKNDGFERVSLLLDILGQKNRFSININKLASAG